MSSGSDPVRERRRRWAELARTGQRIGYLLLVVAVSAFVVGAITGFEPWITAVVIACLAATTLTLAPAIVLGYAVRAAEREDRERGQ